MTGIEADRLGRTIALHLRKNNFGAAHRVLLRCEEDLKRPPEAPVNIAELNMDYRVISMLEAAGYLTLQDLQTATEEDLLKIPNIRGKAIASIRCALKRAIEENKALCR